MFANNALLGGEVRVRVWIRKTKRRSMTLLNLWWQTWTSLYNMHMHTKAGLNVTESCTVQVVLQPIYHAGLIGCICLCCVRQQSPFSGHSSTTDEAWYWPKHVLHSGWFCIANLQVEITVVTAHCLHVREQCSSWNVTVDTAYIHHMRILHHEYHDIR